MMKEERYITLGLKKKIKKKKNKSKELTLDNPESANYWSIRLLWGDK